MVSLLGALVFQQKGLFSRQRAANEGVPPLADLDADIVEPKDDLPACTRRDPAFRSMISSPTGAWGTTTTCSKVHLALDDFRFHLCMGARLGPRGEEFDEELSAEQKAEIKRN